MPYLIDLIYDNIYIRSIYNIYITYKLPHNVAHILKPWYKIAHNYLAMYIQYTLCTSIYYMPVYRSTMVFNVCFLPTFFLVPPLPLGRPFDNCFSVVKGPTFYYFRYVTFTQIAYFPSYLAQCGNFKDRHQIRNLFAAYEHENIRRVGDGGREG